MAEIINNTISNTAKVIRPINDTPDQLVSFKKDPLILLREINDLIEVFTDTASTNSASIRSIQPKRLYDQIKLEDTGFNRRLWIFIPGDDWRHITLT